MHHLRHALCKDARHNHSSGGKLAVGALRELAGPRQEGGDRMARFYANGGPGRATKLLAVDGQRHPRHCVGVFFLVHNCAEAADSDQDSESVAAHLGWTNWPSRRFVTVRVITVDQSEGWTPPQHESAATALATATFVEDRAVIEEAKGVLMAVYSIDAEAAFDLLKWGSEHTDTKLRAVADQLITGFRSLR
jgi:hypothetical protein